MADEDFDTGSAGASTTFPQQAGALRKGGFVVIKGHPCKIVEITTSKTGKHGHAKANITALDIFSGKKYEDICPTSHNTNVPVVKREELTVLDITDDGFVSLLLDSGDTKDDLKVPEGEVGETLKKDFAAGKDLLVTVQAAMNMEAIIAVRESAN